MEMVINMGVRLPFRIAGAPIECECCGKNAIGVCSVIALPYSAAFCATCLYFGAQPIMCVESVYAACGGDVADWYKDECRVWTLAHGYESIRSYDARVDVFAQIREDLRPNA